MAYTTIDNPELYFQTKLYTGNGGTQSITLDGSEDMQPDFIWFKARNAGEAHDLVDSVRGNTKYLASNNANAEATASNGVTSFDSNGFSMGLRTALNGSGMNFVAWCWKAGTSFSNDASATGIGTIDSSGSFNNDSGFSIVSWTGTGSNGTIKHGMNTTPSFIAVKNLGGTDSWMVYHKNSNSTPEDYILQFNTTITATDNNTIWNDTAPTSSVFSIGTDNGVNQSSKNYIAYCFAEKKGYSKFGGYTGNGNALGPMIWTGFSPAFLITKRTDSADNWGLLDNKRDGYNLTNKALTPNSSGAEYTSNSPAVDFLANGFKIRESDGVINGSGGTYIFMAFAESPFVTSTGIPTTAR